MTNIPESNRKVFAVTFIIAVISLFIFVAYTKYQVKHDPFGPESDIMATNPDPSKIFDAPITKADLYYIDLERYKDDLKNKNVIGCGDSLLPYEIAVGEEYGATKSDAVTYVLEKLLNNSTFEKIKAENNNFNVEVKINPYNALSRSKLTLKNVKEIPGEYEVRLAGIIGSGGVCDDPRIENQIKNTIDQIFAPESVDIYINDKLLKDSLSQK